MPMLAAGELLVWNLAALVTALIVGLNVYLLRTAA